MEISTFITNFANILDDTDPSVVTEDKVFRDIEEWSSLTALSLIAMVDEEYSIKFTGDDIKTSVTIKDLFEKVKSKS
jgi:acyl carrier protein